MNPSNEEENRLDAEESAMFPDGGVDTQIENKSPLHFPEELTDELRFILGRPNFYCGTYAEVFRLAGHAIPTKAEEEQAFIIHWLTKLLLRHGSEWRLVAYEEFEAVRAKAKELVALEAQAAAKQSE